MVKRNTLILVLVALLLAVGVFAFDRLQTQQQQVSADKNRVLGIQPSQVRQIELAGDEIKEPIRLERLPQPSPASGVPPVAAWKVVAPIATAADGFTVNTLLQSLATLQPQARVEPTGPDPLDLSEFGLAPPRKRLTLTLEDGSSRALKLGTTDFDGSGIYAQADAGGVVTLPSSQQATLAPTLYALRDKTLLSVSDPQVQFILLRAGQSTIRLDPIERGWQLSQPRQLPADPATIDQLLSSLRTLQALSFVAETQANLTDFGLDRPSSELTIQLRPLEDQPRDPLSLALGKVTDDQQVYVITSASPAVATIAKTTADTLRPSLDQLRSKQLGRILPDTLAEVKIEAADASLSRTLLPAADRNWEISDQAGRSVTLSDLFSALSQAQAREFLPANDSKANAALKKPLFTLTLKPLATSSDPTLTLAFAQDGSRTYVRSSFQPDILVLDGLESIQKALKALQPSPSPSP